MILVRDVFRLKFGKAKDALAVWKEMTEQAKRSGLTFSPRTLTDLVGPFYTLVIETTATNLHDWEQNVRKGMADPAFHALYQKFTPLVESGYREVFTIHD